MALALCGSCQQVSWSPDWPQLLASMDDDNRMFLWDVGRTVASPTDFLKPPQVGWAHGPSSVWLFTRMLPRHAGLSWWTLEYSAHLRRCLDY